MTDTPKQTALLVAVTAFGAAAFCWALLNVEASLEGRLLGWLALLLATVAVGLFPVKIAGTTSVISVTDPLIFVTLLFFGVSPAVILAAVDALLSSRRVTRKLSSNIYNFSVMSLSVFCAGRLFELLLSRPDLDKTIPLQQLAVPLAAMALTHFLMNSGLVAMATALKTKTKLVSTWVENYLWSSLSFFTGAAAAAVIYTFVRDQGLVAFAVVFPILLITYYTHKTSMHRVQQKNEHIEKMSGVYISTIEALTMAIDAKDQITYGHVRRVRSYAIGLGTRAGLSPDEMEGIRAASLLHDIGKLAIPEYILNKPGKLSAGEFEKMKSHPNIGSEILSNVQFPYPVIPMVKHHHESMKSSSPCPCSYSWASRSNARVLRRTCWKR